MNKKNLTWQENYNLAKIYYDYYGNLEIPTRFKTTNGYIYDEEGINIGRWIITQRKNYQNNKLSNEQVELLNNLNMRFNNIRKIKSWEDSYELAKNYYNYYEDLEIPSRFKTKNGINFDEDGYNLGYWIKNQRVKFKNGMLNDENLTKLNEIGFRTEKLFFTWDEIYNLAKIYYEHHKNLEIPSRFKTKDGYTYDEEGYFLGSWMNNQKNYFRNNLLDDNKKNMLEEIKINCEKNYSFKNTLSWNEMYELTQAYYNHYGNTEIKFDFKTKDGINFDEDGYSLGHWIRNQRVKFKKGKMDLEKFELLSNLKMRFENKIRKKSWDEMYSLAKIYYEYHNNLNISTTFKTSDGYSYDKDGIFLGLWLSKQKQSYKEGKINEERYNLLKQLHFDFIEETVNEKNWKKLYELIKKYINYYQNTNIQINFRTNDGINFDENGHSLGVWLNTQKQNYRNNKLSKEKIDLLESIGIEFKNIYLSNWIDMYNLAKIYYDHYGNLDMPSNFKTKDGINFDEEGKKLRKWIDWQRSRYKNNELSEEKIKLLQDLKINFDTLYNTKWNIMYNLAKIYYNYYGNLDTPSNFKTKDGIKYDKDGYNLDSWLNTQKQNYKNKLLENNKIELLNQIGLICDKRKNKFENIKFIEEIGLRNKLQYENCKSIVERIPNKELVAKINYLIENNMILENNNELHEIFFMSNLNMQAKYNISIEELIERYYSKGKKLLNHVFI